MGTPYEGEWGWLGKAERRWPNKSAPFREELHPRVRGGRFGEKPDAPPPPRSDADVERFIGQVERTREYAEVHARLSRLEAETRGGDVRFWSREKYTRDGEYVPERRAIHDRIAAKLLTPGSVAPKGERPVAVFLMGAPGAGKTSAGQPLVRKIIKSTLAVINADDIKESLPEYQGWNAGALHGESTDVLEGTIMRKAVSGRHNMLLDLTGNNSFGLRGIAESLARRGYDVHLVNVSAPTWACVGRAWSRFLATKRFVPLSYVAKSDHKSDVAYDLLKGEGYVKSWASVENSGEHPVLVERGTR